MKTGCTVAHETLDFFLSAGATLAESCLIFLLMVFFFPKRNLPKPAFLSVFVCAWIFQLAKHFFQARYSAWMPLYSIVVDFATIWLCFIGKVKIKALFLALVYCVFTCCESLVFSFIMIVAPQQIIGLHSEGIQELIVFVLSKAIQSIVVIVMTNFGWIKHKLVIRRVLVLLFLLIPMAGALGIYILYPRAWFTASIPMLLIMLLFSAFVLAFILILFYFIVVQARAEDQLENAQRSDENVRTYLQEIARAQISLRKLLHDSRYSFIHLRFLLDRRETDKAKEYIQTLDKALISEIPARITGNAQADSILYYYENLFSGAGIKLKVLGRLPPELNILPQDLARLLGNALDNAMEACNDCTVPDRTVSIDFAYDKGYLSIRATNPYAGRLKRTGGRLRSTRPDAIEHGYGMAIMEELAKIYNGGVFFEAGENSFILRIVLREPDDGDHDG